MAKLYKNDKNNGKMELAIVTLSGDSLQERSKQNTQYVSVKNVNTDVEYAIARAEDMAGRYFECMPYDPKDFRKKQKIEGWEYKPVIDDYKALKEIAKETEQNRA